MDVTQFEEDYARFVNDLPKWIPDGIIEINLKLLSELGLLDEEHWKESSQEEKFPHYFHVNESQEKITLYNQQFVIWIIPQLIDDESMTLTLISLLSAGKLHLEMAFLTRNVFNTPKIILRVLKHYLEEVLDTHDVISSMNA